MAVRKEMPAPRGCAARPGYSLKPEYVTIHNTGNGAKGAGALNHGKYLQNAGKGKTVSWHYVVDDGMVVQCIPEDENAWHAGDGAGGIGNRKSLSIEICENPESDLKKATDNAAELTAELMRRYGIPLEHVVQHNHWNGKNCPHLIRAGIPYSWQAFLNKVQRFYEDAKASEDTTPEKETQQAPTVPVYTLNIGPMTVGDRQTLVRKARELGLPVKEV